MTTSTLSVQFSTFEFNTPAFLATVKDDFTRLMLLSAEYAYRLALKLVPVWTGESRGGFRELAKRLGVAPSTISVIEKRTRKNRHGATKTPTSGGSEVSGPEWDGQGRVIFQVFNDADGFFYNDRGGVKGPWGFFDTFSRKMIQDLAQRVRVWRPDIRKFAFRKVIQ